MPFGRLLLAFLAALVLPSGATAGVAAISSYELPLAGERAPAAVAAAREFQLVGLHWRGGGLEYRVHSSRGWSAWRRAEAETGDAPDRRSPEARRGAGWKVSAGVWVGTSDRIEVRPLGDVRRAKVFTVSSPVVKVPLRTTAAAGAPAIVPRSGWLADESLRRNGPSYADTVRLAFVHHTAGSNVYTPEQAPAIVRAIQIYHVKGNGWNDIGYNALVDKYGTVYEGRYGGITRNVVGAHARGFNTGSFGIAYLGNFESTEPPQPGVDALARTIAWKLDVAHVDAVSTLTGISAGNERFTPGVPVFLRAVSGHRDTGATTCPGDRLYARLFEIASQAGSIGLPKLYEPLVEGRLGGPIRFRARLSSAQPWTVTITDAAGLTIGEGSGTGTGVDWTWDATLAVATGYRWRIAAGTATPASGSVGASVSAPEVQLAFSAASADPEAISPNQDAQGDSTTIVYTLNAAANVSATVVDFAGNAVAELEGPRWRRPGEHTLSFDGLGLPDGAYTIRLLAKGEGGLQATTDVAVAITRTLGAAKAAPAVITPNGDGRGDRLSVSFALNGPASVRVRVLREGKWVATAFAGELAAGLRVVRWDGSKRVGSARDGVYEALVEAVDPIGTTSVRLPFAKDATAPVVRVLSAAKPVRLWVSEPVRLTLRINGAVRRLEVALRGEVRVPRIEKVSSLVVVARDAAGNKSTLRKGYSRLM
jgi:hypothetical protein